MYREILDKLNEPSECKYSLGKLHSRFRANGSINVIIYIENTPKYHIKVFRTVSGFNDYRKRNDLRKLISNHYAGKSNIYHTNQIIETTCDGNWVIVSEAVLGHTIRMCSTSKLKTISKDVFEYIVSLQNVNILSDFKDDIITKKSILLQFREICTRVAECDTNIILMLDKLITNCRETDSCFITHGDLSLDNLLMTKAGIKVIDFEDMHVSECQHIDFYQYLSSYLFRLGYNKIRFSDEKVKKLLSSYSARINAEIQAVEEEYLIFLMYSTVRDYRKAYMNSSSILNIQQILKGKYE